MYIDVKDAAATQSAIEANGGTTVVAPMEVMDAGSMGVFTDPTGAAFCLWQPARHKGAEVVNEAGAFSWAELMTRDIGRAVDFYSAVFGWTEKNGPESPYKEFQVEGDVVAGGQAIGPEMPAEVPPHWNIYFGCSDVDATAAKVAELGGTVRMAPFDIPDVGRIAVVGGPHHEGFSLFGY
jgi:predicted enzyme related to lactoylglutathione lyase